MSTAIISVVELPQRKQKISAKRGARNHTRQFLIETNNKKAPASDLEGATDPSTGVAVPSRFDEYPEQIGCFCQDITFDQLDRMPWTYMATAEYSSLTDIQNQDDKEDNPLNRPVVVNVSFDRISKIAYQDINGDAILNTALEPYDPPIEVDSMRPVITFTRNLGSFSFPLLQTYRDAINSDTFYGFPALSLKIVGIAVNQSIENNQTIYTLTVSMAVHESSWRIKVLSRGYTYLDGGVRKPISDSTDGMPTQTPQNLGENGELLGPSDAPYFQTFQVYPELPFSALNLL